MNFTFANLLPRKVTEFCMKSCGSRQETMHSYVGDPNLLGDKPKGVCKEIIDAPKIKDEKKIITVVVRRDIGRPF